MVIDGTSPIKKRGEGIMLTGEFLVAVLIVLVLITITVHASLK